MIEAREQLRYWIGRLIPFGKSMNEYVQWMEDGLCGNCEDEYVGHVIIYTRTHSYSIRGVKRPNEKGYLGCIASARKPLAGESHTRGNDLADGPFCYTTFESIVMDILRYELVKIAHSARWTNRGDIK